MNGDRIAKKDKHWHVTSARELRTKIGITIMDNFVLSTERIPIWCKQSSFTILQAEHFDAAVRLDCYREDFDVKHVDGLCMALRGTQCYDKLCDWILELCGCLLNPSEIRPKIRRTSISGWTFIGTGYRNQVRDESKGPCEWLLNSTQDERFTYFRNKVGRLHILRENGNALFERLKSIVDECMLQIGNLCIGRFVQLISEEKGHDLRCLDNWQDRSPPRKSEQSVEDENTEPKQKWPGLKGKEKRNSFYSACITADQQILSPSTEDSLQPTSSLSNILLPGMLPAMLESTLTM